MILELINIGMSFSGKVCPFYPNPSLQTYSVLK